MSGRAVVAGLGPSMRSAVEPFGVMGILDEVARRRRAGEPVISLCVGEPSAGPPPDVLRAAQRVHDGTHPTGYTPALGTHELREAIARFYDTRYGLAVDPRNVAVTTGSSGAFVAGFLAAFDHGDRVALARPGYPAYRNILQAYGCDVVELPCDASVRYQPTVAMLATAHEEAPLAGVVIASPANPTGTMIRPDELAAIATWCAEQGVRLVSDEIYHGITFHDDGAPLAEPTSAWGLSGSALVVSSFSKYWGMTGWRLGWALVPDDLLAAVDALVGNMALCPPAAAQYAAVEAFTEDSLRHCREAVTQYAGTRRVFLARAAELGWGLGAPADGAFYYYADLGPVLDRWPSSTAYAAALLAATGVAVTPGVDFDRVHGSGTVRVSLAVGEAQMSEAVDRIVAFHRAATP